MSQHDFCRTLLMQVRKDAKDKGVALPRGITALSDGNGQWFMEAKGRGAGSDIPGEYVSADCGYEARAKYIDKIIARKVNRG